MVLYYIIDEEEKTHLHYNNHCHVFIPRDGNNYLLISCWRGKDNVCFDYGFTCLNLRNR